MLKLPDRNIISLARQVTKICLEEIAAAGRLHLVVAQPDDFIGELATGMLADCLQAHQLKLEMLERWTQEIVSQMHHACGHVLRSERERAELRCMECRLTLLMRDVLVSEQ